jgi:16S rRNA (cytosine1402-N4)-methyltransferase
MSGAESTSRYHVPVLLDEVISALVTDREWTYVDGTLGGGGHAEALCRLLEGAGRLIAFDADEEAIRFSRERLQEYASRTTFVHANFRILGPELKRLGVSGVGGILLDLGVSSRQIDDPMRGFSFRADEPLDMRMDRRLARTAREVVNDTPTDRLADLLYQYGEERASRRIARTIASRRPLATTGDLSRAVEEAVGGRFLVKTLARIFQALRIEVNGELASLSDALVQGLECLRPGGRLVVIAYHSLEDRIVKEFFRHEAATSIRSGNKLVPDTPREARLKVLTPKPIEPGVPEVERNPRARSARCRVAERLAPG